MSTHFSANQYEQAFDARVLMNWQVPCKFKEHPSTLEGFTQIISNDRGHILEGIPRSQKSPWGEFVGTWDMKKPPLRTKTLKTKAMTANSQQKQKTPSPVALRTPSPKAASPLQASPRNASPLRASPRNASPLQASPRNASPLQASPRNTSPTKLRTPSPQVATPSRSPVASPRLAVTPEHC